jgi:hypothetical protein
MRRPTLALSISLLTVTGACLLLLKTPSTHAKGIWFSNWDLRGSWASQLSGTVVFPTSLPGSALNGPYCLTGRVEADGFGAVQGTVYENYNGLLLNYSWQGTYQVNKDGTLTLSAVLDLGGSPYPLKMFGVICDEGKQVRLTQIGPTMGDLLITAPGVPPNLLGSVIVGSWVRQ